MSRAVPPVGVLEDVAPSETSGLKRRAVRQKSVKFAEVNLEQHANGTTTLVKGSKSKHVGARRAAELFFGGGEMVDIVSITSN